MQIVTVIQGCKSIEFSHDEIVEILRKVMIAEIPELEDQEFEIMLNSQYYQIDTSIKAVANIY